MPIRRRRTHVTGEVKFPVDDPRWKHRDEGGMFVRVMVTEKAARADGDWNPDGKWMECSGRYTRVRLDESLTNGEELEKRLWPRLYDANGDPREGRHGDDEFSVPCLAVATLGSTGWVAGARTRSATGPAAWTT